MKINAEEMLHLINAFNEIIIPWCEENKLSLHKAFEISRESDIEKYSLKPILLLQ